MSVTKKYFVFISYSSKDNEDDNKWAEWLLHELDHWHLPADYKGRKPIQNNLREVFRDRDGFSAGKEWDKQVEPKLQESQNLIVICSPNAAKSDAVNKEVELFINQGKEDSIFPFIIEGDSPNDCFPPALKHSKVGGDVNKDGGRDKAFIKVVAGMLGVNFDDLYNRYELEKAEQARLEREKREKLQIAQSRFVAEKAKKLIKEGDSYLARKLAIEVLPKDLDKPDRPYTPEAEFLLRESSKYDTAVLLAGNNVHSVVYSTDGKRIISAVGNKIIIWDAKSGARLNTLCGHTSIVLSVAISSNGKRIVSASADNTIKVRDSGTGELCAVLEMPKLISAELDPSGKYAVSTSYDGTTKIWDVETGGEINILKENYDMANSVNLDLAVRSASFSPDGEYVVSAHSNNTIKVWNAKSGLEFITIKGHKGCVFSAVYSPDGSRIASASDDKTVKIWDSKTGKEIHTLKGHLDTVYSVAFSVDGKRVVSASWDNTVRIWNAESGTELRVFEGHTSRVYSAVFSPDGKRVVSASADSTIRIWELENKIVAKILKGHTSDVNKIAISPNGNCIASSSWDNTCRIWDFRLGKELCVLEGHTSSVDYIAFSPKGRYVASASQDQTIRIWDVKYGKCLMVLKGHNSRVCSVKFSKDGKRIVSSSADDIIRVWDTKSGTELKVLNVNSRCIKENSNDFLFSVFYAEFSPDGKRIVTVSGDETVKVWDWESGLKLSDFMIRDVYHVAFSHDGQQLVSVSSEDIVRFWDTESGTEIGNSETRTSKICSSLFSPDGKSLVSDTIYYNEVKVVDVETKVNLILCKGHTEEVRSVAFSPDGRHIVSSSSDKTIRIWEFPSLQQLIDETRERFKNNPLTPEERRRYYLE